MKHTPTSSIHHQSGFSLVEILVTVVILAGGSLGIAAMQIASLNYSAGSYGRTQAVILAQDMTNRLLANRSYAIDIDVDGDLGAEGNYDIDNFGDTITSTRDCITDACTPAELADYDREKWLENVARALPSGQGMIQDFDTVNDNGITERRFEISLQWRQVAGSNNQDSNDADELQEFTFRVMI